MPSTAKAHPEETVSLRDAKANLSSLTKQAREGTRVIITNHGSPIADLVQHGTGVVPVLHLRVEPSAKATCAWTRCYDPAAVRGAR